MEIRQGENETLDAYSLRLEDQLRRFQGLSYEKSMFTHPKGGNGGVASLAEVGDGKSTIASITESYAVIVAISGLNEANGIQKRELIQKIDRNEDNVPKSRAALFDLLRMSNEREKQVAAASSPDQKLSHYSKSDKRPSKVEKVSKISPKQHKKVEFVGHKVRKGPA